MNEFVGYARVSTSEQVLDLQKDALLNIGCKKIFEDIASGSKSDRPGFKEAIEYCREGDTLVVWKFDRLSRSLRQLIDTMNQLNEKKVGLKSLQENIDTTSTGGKLVFHIFSALAEFERDLIRDRTQAGLKAARARGKNGGRPKAMDQKKIDFAKTLHKNQNLSINEICEILEVKRTTFYKYIKQSIEETAGEMTSC